MELTSFLPISECNPKWSLITCNNITYICLQIHSREPSNTLRTQQNCGRAAHHRFPATFPIQQVCFPFILWLSAPSFSQILRQLGTGWIPDRLNNLPVNALHPWSCYFFCPGVDRIVEDMWLRFISIWSLGWDLFDRLVEQYELITWSIGLFSRHHFSPLILLLFFVMALNG